MMTVDIRRQNSSDFENKTIITVLLELKAGCIIVLYVFAFLLRIDQNKDQYHSHICMPNMTTVKRCMA